MCVVNRSWKRIQPTGKSMEGQTSFSGAHNGRISGILRIYMDGLLMVPFTFLFVDVAGGGPRKTNPLIYFSLLTSTLFLSPLGRMNIIPGCAFSWVSSTYNHLLHVLGWRSGVYYVNILWITIPFTARQGRSYLLWTTRRLLARWNTQIWFNISLANASIGFDSSVLEGDGKS